MALTVLDVIKSALRAINAIALDDDVQATEANEAFAMLNGMLDEWSNQRFMCYELVTDTYTLTGNKFIYTIGPDPTADFNGPRPVQITSMFTRQGVGTTSVDYPIQLITNAQYQALSLKNNTSTYPMYAMLESSFPLAKLYFYPMPTLGLQFLMTRWSQISQFTSLAQTVAFPPGYQLAIVFNLAQLLPALGHNPPAAVMARVDALAKRYMASVKKVNNREPVVAESEVAMLGGSDVFPNVNANIMIG